MKRLLYAFGGVLVLAAAGAFALSAMLGPAVKAAVETLGPKVAGVPMRLSGFSVSPLTGSMKLTGLYVGNPPGFKTPSAFELGSVRASVKLSSLMSDTIVVERVWVRGAEATYEFGPGGSNIAVIQRAAESFAGGAAKEEPKAASGKPAKKLVIRDFRFEGAKARVSASLLGGKAVEVPIPDIHLTDVGGEKGASPAKVAAQLIGSVSGGVVKAAMGVGKQAADAATDAVKAAGKAVGGLKKLFR